MGGRSSPARRPGLPPAVVVPARQSLDRRHRHGRGGGAGSLGLPERHLRPPDICPGAPGGLGTGEPPQRLSGSRVAIPDHGRAGGPDVPAAGRAHPGVHTGARGWRGAGRGASVGRIRRACSPDGLHAVPGVPRPPRPRGVGGGLGAPAPRRVARRDGRGGGALCPLGPRRLAAGGGSVWPSLAAARALRPRRAPGAVRVRGVALRHAKLLPARHAAAHGAGHPPLAVSRGAMARSGVFRVRPARPGAARASARPDHRSDGCGPAGAPRGVPARVLVFIAVLRHVPGPGARDCGGWGARAAGSGPRLPHGGPPAVQCAGARSLLFRSVLPALPVACGGRSGQVAGQTRGFLPLRRGCGRAPLCLLLPGTVSRDGVARRRRAPRRTRPPRVHADRG